MELLDSTYKDIIVTNNYFATGDNTMKGLELSKLYYKAYGLEMLETYFPMERSRMAIGLAGEGSECFGFDDWLSQDHDWGPSFCIWLNEEDYKKIGRQVQSRYNQIPTSFEGFPSRKTSQWGENRVGVLSTPQWYRCYTGLPDGPDTIEQWRKIPEAFLATAVNGEIFYDTLDHFSSIRRKLLAFYPEDVRMKKIAARAAIMSQAGQYNYLRCIKRNEPIAAQMALSEFIKAGISMVYLLNRRYTPFYKWMHKGLQGMKILPCAYDQFKQLSQEYNTKATASLIEEICGQIDNELYRQGLSDHKDSYLQNHCDGLMRRIHDPVLRQSHVLSE